MSLLQTQKEDEAIEHLEKIRTQLKNTLLEKKTLEQLLETFTGEEHNLIVYLVFL